MNLPRDVGLKAGSPGADWASSGVYAETVERAGALVPGLAAAAAATEDAGRILRWSEVAAKVAAARPSLVPYSSTPRPVAVVCAPAEAEQLLAAPGLPAPAVHDTEGNVSILIWR